MRTAFHEHLNVFVDANLTPEALSHKFAELARQRRDELIARHDAAPTFDTAVDGRPGGNEEAARRTIVYRFRYLGDATLYAISLLQAMAPVATGRFRSGFFVGVNGRMIPARQVNARSIPETAEVLIGNLEPYNRKIDVQFVGKRHLHYSVAPDIYRSVANRVRGKFGGIIKAQRRSNINFPGQYILRRGQHRGQYSKSPGLVLTSGR